MGILQKLTEVEQAVVKYAETVGKDVYEVFEEVVAHFEGKIEAAQNGEAESSESGSGTELPTGTHPPAAA